MSFVFRGFISVFIALFYLINSVYAQADLIVSDEKNTQNNLINTNNLNNQSYDIRVPLDHVFISNKNNSLEISEIVVFRNEGQEIYYSKDNHTFFAISTPPDIRDLRTQAMECCLVQEEGVVYMDPMKSIKPGENFEMKISYTLLTQGQGYVFNKSAVYNTTSLSILVDKKSGVIMEGTYDAITLSGIEYNVANFNDLRQGETVNIPVKIVKEPNYLYAGIGLFIIFSTGFVYLLKGKIKSRVKKELTIEELELEKKKIFQTIYGFKKHAGSEESEEYRKLMEEYRKKAIQIYFKIDNLRNKILMEE
jgi:hypothetical protein